MKQSYIPFIVGWIYIGIGFILYFIMAIQGWEGIPSICTETAPCFCEAIDMNALVREPQNTWSNIALMISGLIILFLLARGSPNTTGCLR